MPRTPPKSSSPEGEATRNRVLTAAARLFAKQGFAASSMRDLARETDMSLAGLYHHFESKAELLFEIQQDAFDRLFEPLTRLDETTPADEQIRILIRNHLKFFAGHITEMKVLSHEANALGDPLGRQMQRERRRYYDICFQMVSRFLSEAGRNDLDPRVTTMSLFGMINWIYTWYRPQSGVAADDLARQITAIFFKGIDK